MWNPREHQEEDESWEVKAFAEDSMATTWPPRSYSCTFCRREFRSAQALGGHMNVHRRDRARLHQHNPSNSTASVTPTSYYSHPTPSFTTINPYNQNGGLCYLYHFPSHHTLNPYFESPCNLHSSISPNNLMVMPSCNGFSSYSCTSSKVVLEEEEPTKLLPIHEEQLDLELRLGHR